MDNLARNAMLAKQANMSYGKWKALQEQVKIEPKEEGLICAYCGKRFSRNKYKPKVYCSEYCKYNASYERKQKRKEEDHASL